MYAKVWPLKEGLEGLRLDGSWGRLPLGKAGRMELEEARRREADGEVQLMAGRSHNELIAPEDLDSVPDEGPPPRRRRTYKRRDIKAEKG